MTDDPDPPTDVMHEPPLPPPEDGEPLYGVSRRRVEEIRDLLHEGRSAELVAEIQDLSAADAADLLSQVSEDNRRQLLTEHLSAFDPYTFSELPADLAHHALEIVPPAQAAAILSEMDSDDALDMIVDLDEDLQKEIIHKLSSKMRVTLEEGLSFPEDSAGRLMQREFVAIPQFWTVGKTIDYMRAAAADLPDEFFDIFVITPTYRVVGVVPINRIVRSSRSVKLDDLKLEDIHPLPADMDQEEVARIFRREDLSSAPVIDAEGRLIGVITFDDVVDVIDEEAEEDLMKIAGVSESDLWLPILSTSWARSKWLIINLLTEFAAAWTVSLFSGTIEKVVALATLNPIVAGMGGNAGTQSLAVIVRAIAISELSGRQAPRAVYKEAAVGFLNGALLAVICGVVIWLWFSSPVLGLIIGLAMIINLLVAGIFGALIPIVLNAMGYDPAISAAIFLTTVTDVMGFFSFLGLATLFMSYLAPG
jgi:magnesium transporter